jgi:hypothetical protein
MKPPKSPSHDHDLKIIAQVFNAPLVTKGWTWLPLTQLITWLVMTREAGRLHPERSWNQRLGIAALTMPIILGSEWSHNLAHAAAAKSVGKPVDAIRVNFGMPLLVYNDIEDPTVSPRQHIIRASGGPLINTILLGIANYLWKFTTFGSPARDVLDAARWTNLLLIIAGMTPQPWLDGGVILKWACVDRGLPLEAADAVVQKVNGAAGVAIGLAAAGAAKKGK